MVGGSSGGASRSPLCSDSSVPGALGAFKGMERSQLPEPATNVQMSEHWKPGSWLKKRWWRAAQILGGSLANTPKLRKPRLWNEPARFPAFCITHSMRNSYFKVFQQAAISQVSPLLSCLSITVLCSVLLGLYGANQSQSQQHCETIRTGMDTSPVKHDYKEAFHSNSAEMQV